VKSSYTQACGQHGDNLGVFDLGESWSKARQKKKRKKKPRYGLSLIDKGLQGCSD
jgi:hypothetical protein